MVYLIKDKNSHTKAEIKKISYEGTHMGDAYVSFDYNAPQPFNWQIGDYIMFRGERFTLNVLPTAIRYARDNSRGDAVQYKSVRFQSAAIALLQDAMMLDYVTEDNNIHFTSLPNFSFYCADDMVSVTQEGEAVRGSRGLWQLADRLKANVQRAYPTLYWKVIVEDDTAITKPQSISVSSQSIWNVLADACDKLEVNFTVKSEANNDDEPHPDDDPVDYSILYTITLGAIVHEIDNEFRYGKEQGISQGNGLMKIEREADEQQQIITRLYAYGNTRNIPYRYYNNIQGVSESMYLPNLMLPMFRTNHHTAYVDSANISSLGVREGTKFFDGSDDSVPDIYPSITGMTTQIVYDALSPEERERQDYKDPEQYPAYDQGALDEVYSAEAVNFDGIVPEQQQTAPTFVVRIKNLGFDPNEQIISGETPKINFNTGMMAGRECNIRSITKETAPLGNAPTLYKLICEVVEDTSLGQYFPNVNYNIVAGDKFTLIAIRMPDIYVQAAEIRLQAAAETFLALNDHTQYNYKLTIDNIYMARHGAIANQLLAGTKLHIYDQSLGIDEHETISQLKITVGEKQIPEYEVTLAEKVEPSLIQRTTNELEVKMQQQADALTTANTNRIIEAINKLNSKFIYKQGVDRAVGPVSFTNGIFAGQSGADKYAHITDGEIMICAAESTPILPSGVQYEPLQMSLKRGTYTKSIEYKASFAPASTAIMHFNVGLVTRDIDDVTVQSAMVSVVNNDDNVVVLSQNIDMDLGSASVSVDIGAGNKRYNIGFAATFTVNTRQLAERKDVTMVIGNVTVVENTITPSTAMKLTKDGLYRLTGTNTWTQVV